MVAFEEMVTFEEITEAVLLILSRIQPVVPDYDKPLCKAWATIKKWREGKKHPIFERLVYDPEKGSLWLRSPKGGVYTVIVPEIED